MTLFPRLTSALVIAIAVSSLSANATTVQFQTSLGDFEVILFDEGTPLTVANFLDYVEAGAYTDSVIHRSVSEFVVQGGGYTFPDDQPSAITTNAPVLNEPEYSNVTGTIAMAKLGGDEDSATSQWFFNLKDNSTNLDVQNGGFTAFGQVKGDGMDVVEAIAQVSTFNMGSSFTNFPLVDYTQEDYDNFEPVTADNVVTIYAIVVTDAATDTLGDLEPVENDLIDAVPTPEPDTDKGDGGGGSLDMLMVLLLAALGGFSTRLRARRRH